MSKKRPNSQLASDATPDVDAVPPGWRSLRQIAADEGYSRAHTGALMSRCVDAGTWERRDYRVVIHGTRRVVPHYRRTPDAK